MPGPLVVITGATHGIGLALASRFSAAGHALLLVSRHMTTDPELPDCLHVPADVADFPALSDAIRRAEEAYGPVACLINDAGFLKFGMLQDRDVGEMSYEVDVLLKGVLHGVRAVLPGMAARKHGTIINISSIGDRTAGPQGEVYHACKAAVRSLSMSLQKGQAANNVRVVNVAPGFVRTDIHREMGLSFEEYSRMLGNPTFIDPVDLAEIIFHCWSVPESICIRDIVIMPTDSSFG